MDFLSCEHAVILTGFKNIDNGYRLSQYVQNQQISHHVHWVKSPYLHIILICCQIITPLNAVC